MAKPDDIPDQTTAAAARLPRDPAQLTSLVLSLMDQVTALSDRVARAEAAAEWYRDERDRAIEQIKLANARRFCPSTERALPDQISLFNDVEAAADPGAAEPVPEGGPEAADGPRSGRGRQHRRGGKRVIDLARLHRTSIDCPLMPEQLVCGHCGGAMEEIGEEVVVRIGMVPAHLEAFEYHIHKCVCPDCCGRNARDGSAPASMARAEAPEPPFPGSIAEPSLVSWILDQKYVEAKPLYRMETELCRMGAPISRANMSNWCMWSHERWFSPLWERMRAHLLEGPVINADETRTQVLDEPDRSPGAGSWMWVFCTPELSKRRICLFRYAPTRAGTVAEEFLGGYSGTVTSDGYGVYFQLEGVTNTACLVHVRRKFTDIVKAAGGDAKAAASKAVMPALDARKLIDRIFEEDRRLGDLDDDARRELRGANVRPLMEAFQAWAEKQMPRAPEGFALQKALAYALRYWPYVMNALGNGGVDLSNSVAERAIRPYAIGRKNWLFSNTPRGAEASAGIYSIMTTALANGLDPRLYAEWLLTKMPNTPHSTDDPAVTDRFLPWSPDVPDSCRLSPEAAAKLRGKLDEPVIELNGDAVDED